MKDKRVGVIGYGAIGRSIVDEWPRKAIRGYRLSAVLVRADQAGDARAAIPPEIAVASDFSEFLEHCPHVVIEAAGHAAASAYGEAILLNRTDLLMLSTGALAAAGVLERMRRAAE